MYTHTHMPIYKGNNSNDTMEGELELFYYVVLTLSEK